MATRTVSARSGSQGFKPHWDTHDVFVLQVEGSKRWGIYGGGPELPLKDQKFDPDVHAPGEVDSEFTLQAGEAVSLHITMGVISYTWADLLVDGLAELVERNPRWRENVPFGFAGDGTPDAALASTLAGRISGLPAELDLDAVVRERHQTFAGNLRPRTIDHLSQAVSSPDLRREDQVRWREGVPDRIERGNGRVVIASRGREVDFPAAATRTLEHLLVGEALTGGAIDDGLDWESRQ